MPYHRPIPNQKRGGPAAAGSGMFAAWVQAEKFIQIVLTVPAAGLIGWLGGYGLDRWLHRTWIAMAGVVFGMIAGIVGAIRMGIAYSADPKLDTMDESGNEGANTGARRDSDKGS